MLELVYEFIPESWSAFFDPLNSPGQLPVLLNQGLLLRFDLRLVATGHYLAGNYVGSAAAGSRRRTCARGRHSRTAGGALGGSLTL